MKVAPIVSTSDLQNHARLFDFVVERPDDESADRGTESTKAFPSYEVVLCEKETTLLCDPLHVDRSVIHYSSSCRPCQIPHSVACDYPFHCGSDY